MMNLLDSRPSLCVVTTYFHESDHEEAEKLGGQLFELLTRPIDSPLSFGAGIPVLSAMRVDRLQKQIGELAETTVVIPVVGATAFFLQRGEVLRTLKGWHKKLGAGRLLLVPIASQWRALESELPAKQMLSELYGSGERRHRTLEEIVLALTRVMTTIPVRADGDDQSLSSSPQLFISHAKADLNYLPVATMIGNYVRNSTTGQDFFDTKSLLPGESLSQQLDRAVKQGVFLAIRGDAYSSRSWCQRELLTAKLSGVPTIVVEVLKEGEKRSSPYAGNAPTIAWQLEEPAEQQAARIVLRAMVEWLRTSYFLKEGERIRKIAELPDDTTVIARTPELLDLAHGRVPSRGVVLYPDPELPVAEHQILKTTFPRLQAVTPTTAYRRFISGQMGLTASSPLEGQRVAVSISDSPDADGPDGFTKYHLQDAIVYLARTLIASGAEIAYGGDLRPGGFTEPLSELISTYNDTARSEASHFLHLYQEASVELGTLPAGLIAEIHHLQGMKAALVPKQEDQNHPQQIYLSDMRRVMTDDTVARVIIGGKTIPKLYAKDSAGYSSIYPGILEEAWRSLQAKKPLYIAGGFGGAAGLVAELVDGHQIPKLLNEDTWKSSDILFELAAGLRANRFFKKLKLPNSMYSMAKAVQKIAAVHLKNDSSAVAWNGLTCSENRALFRSRDPFLLSSLILKGLLKKSREKAAGKLKIELVRGSVTRAEQLNAIAVATFKDIPLSGAGAALDRAVGGKASSAHAKGKSLVRLDTPGVDADWLLLASLGEMTEFSRKDFSARVRTAAEATKVLAKERGFWRLGVVTFGGAVADAQESAAIMLSTFRDLGDNYSITWFETDKERFEQLRKLLSADDLNVVVTTRQIEADVVRPPVRDDALLMQVSLQREQLTVTLLPPTGTAIASSNTARYSKAQLTAVSQGAGLTARATPSSASLLERGKELTERLLGKNAQELLDQSAGKRLVVVHDVAASQIPFELMVHPAKGTPLVTQVGLNRRLLVAGAAVKQLFPRLQKVGQLNLLMIANPTGDLPGTELEAKQVLQILKSIPRLIKPRLLMGEQATKQAVREALEQADVLHYCGHAFFNAADDNESGLLLANQEVLAQQDLTTLDSLPRIAFVNACEAGRVRGPAAGAEATVAFAEYFLRSGIESYLGTYWQVSDEGAATFAASVYSGLASGLTLNESVRQARQKLMDDNSNEWANYMLYGNGDFQLLNRQS